MPRLVAVATAVPPHRVDQADARSFAQTLFGNHFTDLDRLLPLFDNAGIRSRYFSRPLEWFGSAHSFEEKNRIYIESATRLCVEASRKLFAHAKIDPRDIDFIIYVNTTGLATPSIDARLINDLGLRTNIQRTPVWGLGCAGGASGLSQAYHYAIGHPDARVLICAAELCGLTFIPDDYGKSNLVACALFGEGAAAALVTGDSAGLGGLHLLATQSHFYPDSLGVMGWHVISRGLQVIFDKRIPDIVAANSAIELQTFLEQNGLTQHDVREYLYHPGGTKVVEAYEQAYGLAEQSMRYSRETLADYGNMSSVTILFVLERFLADQARARDGYAVLSALGPGFCSESLLAELS
jgi:alkylresorcinol/alkylpyrone synthase